MTLCGLSLTGQGGVNKGFWCLLKKRLICANHGAANMERAAGESAPGRSRAIAKVIVFLFFIIASICLFRFTRLSHYLTPQVMGDFLDRAGIWAAVVFIAIYVAGVCLLVPGTVLTGLGAAIFGPYWGFVYVWVGATIGASIAFWIGRTLGRDFAVSLIGEKLRRYDDAIERNGFTAVLYLRLMYFPFTPMNFGMGLTKIRFGDYFWGTALGISVGTFVFTFFIGTIRNIWVSGDLRLLLSPVAYLSLALFIFSLLIPGFFKNAKNAKNVFKKPKEIHKESRRN